MSPMDDMFVGSLSPMSSVGSLSPQKRKNLERALALQGGYLKTLH
jgi:hypothetical protein